MAGCIGLHHRIPLSGAGAVHPINGRLRDELLNETTFTSLAQARVLLEDWRRDYNGVRPHSGIGWLTPDAYAAQFVAQRGRAAALAGGYASRPLTTEMSDEFNRQTLIQTG